MLHLNDWQTGLIPVYLREVYGDLPDKALRAKYERSAARYSGPQYRLSGHLWRWDMNVAGLDWKLFNKSQPQVRGQWISQSGPRIRGFAQHGQPNLSPRDSNAGTTGCGLQGVLSERRQQLFGIVNGVDYDIWNPATDKYLPAHFSVEAITPGKPQCKAALQQQCGLTDEPKAPLLGVVARLVEQKGVELIGELPRGCSTMKRSWWFSARAIRSIITHVERGASRYPQRVSLTFGFDEGLARRIEAGADLFLMPSLYEPSGLNQLYSMRYGTPPVVRATGGLADTVVDTTLTTLANGTATGFSFQAFTGDALYEATHARHRTVPRPDGNLATNSHHGDAHRLVVGSQRGGV